MLTEDLDTAGTNTWTLAWTNICSMDMRMQSGHVQAAWTGTCSMDMNMQHGLGHEAWAWTCSIYMDMDNEHAAWMQPVLVHAA
jgi:hypothetical protein